MFTDRQRFAAQSMWRRLRQLWLVNAGDEADGAGMRAWRGSSSPTHTNFDPTKATPHTHKSTMVITSLVSQ